MSRKPSMLHLAALLTLALLSAQATPLPVPQQTPRRIPERALPTTASLNGRIRDQFNRAVQAASVTLTHLATRQTFTTQSGAEGIFRFRDLPPAPRNSPFTRTATNPHPRTSRSPPLNPLLSISNSMRLPSRLKSQAPQAFPVRNMLHRFRPRRCLPIPDCVPRQREHSRQRRARAHAILRRQLPHRT